MSYKRFLIEWLDIHGRRHNASRKANWYFNKLM